MKETTRTLVFSAVAALAVLTAWGAHSWSRPRPIEGFEKLRTEFFPDFKDPTAPRGLRVAAFNEDQAEIQTFEVALKDGRWIIPSHNNYPADAKDRLAKTAASVMGITREALASRRESDQEKLGVIDPLLEGGEHLKGRGQRITLTAEDGTTVLADYIIGKKVEDAEGTYYVRAPGEKETYRVKLNVNLSTKFGDWIETDLLKMDADKLVEIVIDRHSIDLARRRFIDKPEKTRLTRTTFSDPWTLEGIDEATEELKADEVRTLVNNLDDLKIVGVRPKPPGLRPDLSIDTKVVRSQGDLIRLQNSLFGKGFLPLEDDDGNVRLGSTEGQVTAGQNDGVEYVLYFGEVFTGSTKEVEVGFATEDESPAESKPDANGADPKKAGEKPAGEGEPPADANGDESKPADADDSDAKPDAKDASDKKKADLRKSRYLLVMARFNEAKLGPVPVKPDPPDADEPKPADEPKDQTPSDPEAKPGEKPRASPEPKPRQNGDEDEEADEARPGQTPSSDADTPAEAELPGPRPDPKAEREAREARYKLDLETYNNDVAIRNGKIEQGKKRVDQLNQRFGDWYYVISAESFDSLRLSRKSLVTEKEKPAEPKNDEPKNEGAKPNESKPGESKPGESKPDE